MQPLQDVLPLALTRLLERMPISPGKVEFAWRAAVGPAIARVTRVTLAEDGHTLRVVVAGAAWRTEMARVLPVIRPRLDTLLGAGLVLSVEVRASDGSVPPR